MLIPQIAVPYFSNAKQGKVYRFLGVQPKLEVSLISSRGFYKNRIINRLIEELLHIMPPESHVGL